MSISITTKGNWDNTENYLKKMQKADLFASLSKYGAMGVDALSNATPVESGLTASSWSYEVEIKNGYASVHWYNTHSVDGRPIAILLQYGHGTGTGGYVQGRDYINPAIKPIFDQIADEVWKVVKG